MASDSGRGAVGIAIATKDTGRRNDQNDWTDPSQYTDCHEAPFQSHPWIAYNNTTSRTNIQENKMQSNETSLAVKPSLYMISRFLKCGKEGRRQKKPTFRTEWLQRWNSRLQTPTLWRSSLNCKSLSNYDSTCTSISHKKNTIVTAKMTRKWIVFRPRFLPIGIGSERTSH